MCRIFWIVCAMVFNVYSFSSTIYKHIYDTIFIKLKLTLHSKNTMPSHIHIKCAFSRWVVSILAMDFFCWNKFLWACHYCFLFLVHSIPQIPWWALWTVHAFGILWYSFRITCPTTSICISSIIIRFDSLSLSLAVQNASTVLNRYVYRMMKRIK